MAFCRYEESLPAEVAAVVSDSPVAWVPWGSLEWHGLHLPLGSTGLKAHAIALRAAERAGGVVLPPTYLSAAALPHPWSVSLGPATLRAVWVDLFGELERAGFEVICLLSGHHAPPHLLALAEAAEASMATPGRRALVVAVRDVELIRSAVHNPTDHGGRWETSVMEALRPDLVRLDQLDSEPLQESFWAHASYREFGIVGRDPRFDTSVEDGRAAVEQAAEAWRQLVDYLRSTGDREAVLALYSRLREEFARQRETVQSDYLAAGSPPDFDWQTAWDDAHAVQLGPSRAAEHGRWFKSRWGQKGQTDAG